MKLRKPSISGATWRHIRICAHLSGPGDDVILAMAKGQVVLTPQFKGYLGWAPAYHCSACSMANPLKSMSLQPIWYQYDIFPIKHCDTSISSVLVWGQRYLELKGNKHVHVPAVQKLISTNCLIHLACLSWNWSCRYIYVLSRISVDLKDVLKKTRLNDQFTTCTRGIWLQDCEDAWSWIQ